MNKAADSDTASVYGLLGSLSRKILEESDVSRILRSICEEGCRVLGADRAMVIRQTGSDSYVNKEILYAFHQPRELLESLKANHSPSVLSDVISSGELEVIPDITKDPRMAEPALAQMLGYSALCAIPLTVEGEFYAGLVFHHLTSREYSGEDRRLAKALGDLASLAIEKASLSRNIEEKAARLEIVERMARTVNSALEPDALFKTIVKEIRKAVSCERCLIATINKDTNQYHTWHVEPESDFDNRKRGFDGSGDCWDQEIYVEHRPVFIDDLRDVSVPRAQELAKAGFRSSMTIPIMQEEKCLAHLGLASTRVKAFTDSDKELIVLIADHLGSAIRNATLYRESEKQKNRLAKLVEMTQGLARGLDLQNLLDSLVATAAELLRGDHSRIFFFDEKLDVLTLSAWYGKTSNYQYIGQPLENKNTFAEKVIRSGKEAIVQDIQVLQKGKSTDWVMNHGIHSIIAQPLFRGEKIIGVINCLSKKPAFFSQEDLDLLGSLASQAAVAIEDNRLFNEAREHGARQEIIARIGKAVGSTMEPVALFKTIVSEIRKAVPCERCIIAVIDRETFQYHTWHFESDIELGPREQGYEKESDWWDAAVYEENRAIIINDLRDVTFSRGKEMVKAGLRSTMSIPILQEEKCIAHLGLSSARVNAFTESDKELLVSIADHLGPAIRNATLFRESENQRERLAIQNRIAEAAGSTLEPQELFKIIVREIRNAIPCERCVIAKIDRETNQFHAWHFESDIELDVREQGYEKESDWWDGPVYVENRAIIINDLRDVTFPRGKEMAEAGFRSSLVVPIIQNEKVIAHLALSSARANAFTESDKDLLVSIADHLGSAIRNATLYRESEKQRKRLAIQNRIAEAVGSALEPQELFKIIVREIRNAIPCERCNIATLDREANVFHIWHGESEFPFESRDRKFGKSTNWWDRAVYEEKRAVIVGDLREIPFSRARAMAKAGFRSSLVVPIIQNEKVIAHLGLSSTRESAFGEDDKDLLISIAGHLGTAIRNVTLFQEAGERASRLSVLNELNRKISANLSLDETLQSVVRAVVELLGADHCRLFLVDESSRAVRLQASFGRHSGKESPHVQYQTGEGLVGWTIEQGVPANVPNVLKDNRWLGPGWADSRDVRSCICHPLRINNSVVGAISTMSHQEGFFKDEDLELLDSISSQAAVAINNASLYKAAEKRTSRLTILNELNKKITLSLDLTAILSNIAGATVNLLGADHVRIYLMDERSSQLTLRTTAGGIPGPGKDKQSILPGEGLAGYVFREGAPMSISDVRTDPHWRVHASWAADMGLYAYMAHPIHQAGGVLGVIACLSKTANFFVEEDLQLLGTLASHSAIAIEKSRLFEETQKHAARQEITAKIAKAVGSTLEPEELFKAIVRELRKAVPCERCFISMPGRDIEYNWQNEPDIDVEAYDGAHVGSAAHWARDVYEKKRLVKVGNLREHPSPRAQALAEAGFQSALAVPILQGERCIAQLSLLSTKLDGFTSAHESFLISINDHLGSAIRNASMYKAAKKRAMRFGILSVLNKKVTENLDLQEVLSSFAVSTVHLVNAGHVQIFLFDEAASQLTLRVSSGSIHRPEMDGGASRPKESMTQYVFQEGKPIISPNVKADSRFLSSEWIKTRGFHAYIGQPIRRREKTIGVISCLSQPEGFFNEEDLELLGALASQAAIAIQNAGVHLELKKSLEELHRSQDMIIRAEKLSSLGVLAAGAAHEILNPSSVIQIRAEMLRELSLPGSKEKYHSEIILKNVERIRKICDNLRRFSREEKTKHRVFSLEFLIRETAELFHHEFRLLNIDINLDLDYEVSMIEGEMHQIQQVFVILLTNSRDAIPNGGEITIKSNDVVIDGKSWRKVSVSDTGKGIPEPIQSKIFDPFFTTKSEDEGTGLGLSVLHGILENHKGTVQVKSEMGKGTTFIIYLPTAEGYFYDDNVADDPQEDESDHSSLVGDISK